MGLCKITLPQAKKEKTHLWRHIAAIQTALISAVSRREFGIIEFWEARRTSYPAHFTVLSQTGLISPISWMNARAPDARALPHICVQRRRSPSLSWELLIWLLDLGHGFMRRWAISAPYISPWRLRAGLMMSCEPNQSSEEPLRLSNCSYWTWCGTWTVLMKVGPLAAKPFML